MQCPNRFITICVLLLSASVVPCGTALALSERASNAPDEDAALPASVAALPGIRCARQQKNWNYQCEYGHFEIATYPAGCSTHGFYGMVYASGDMPTVVMQNTFPQGNEVAKLQEQQLVCVSAEAHVKGNNDVAWYYLTAIPRDSVKACKGKPECGPGNLHVEWARPGQRGAVCHLRADGYEDACASGWVKAENFSEFSNGL